MANFVAVSLGDATVSASLQCNQLPPSLASAPIKVVSCTGDLNGDGIVEDTDFVIFYAGYLALLCDSPEMEEGCPGDLTLDGSVDEVDFGLFAEAYNAYFCEPEPPIR